MEAYQNAALSPEERAKDLLGKMTLQEKVGQLNQRLYGFRIYERQGEEFTLTEEFKEEVERMGGLGVLYGLYRALGTPGMSVVLTIVSLGMRVALAYALSAIPALADVAETVADGGSGKLTCELRDELLGIQLGEVEDPHNWMWKVC